MILNVNPEPPVADAEILPLLDPADDALVTVPLTLMVTPVHGFEGGGVVPPPLSLLLLHDNKKKPADTINK